MSKYVFSLWGRWIPETWESAGLPVPDNWEEIAARAEEVVEREDALNRAYGGPGLDIVEEEDWFEGLWRDFLKRGEDAFK